MRRKKWWKNVTGKMLKIYISQNCCDCFVLFCFFFILVWGAWIIIWKCCEESIKFNCTIPNLLPVKDGFSY